MKKCNICENEKKEIDFRIYPNLPVAEILCVRGVGNQQELRNQRAIELCSLESIGPDLTNTKRWIIL
jgi:hypothetical protein